MKTKYDNHCPSAEKLSEYFDGESPVDGPIAKHVADCPYCKKVIAAYQAIKNVCSKQVVQVTDSKLSSIRDEFWHRQRELPRHRQFPVTLVLGLAAAFLVAAGVISMVLQQYLSSIPTPMVAKVQEVRPQMATNKNKLSSHYPYYTGNEFKTVGGVIPARSLIGANAGDHFSPVFTSHPNSVGSVPVPIGGNVKQVWTMNSSIPTAKSTLQKALKNLGADCNAISCNGNNIKLQTVMTKRQLVNLVRNCANSGMELLSPQSPQPEQHEFFGNADDPVYYSMEIIPGN